MAKIVLFRDQQIGDKKNLGEIIYPITTSDAVIIPTTTVYTVEYFYIKLADGTVTSVTASTDDDGNTVYTDTDGNEYDEGDFSYCDEDGNDVDEPVRDEENSESTTTGGGSMTEVFTNEDSALNTTLRDNVIEYLIGLLGDGEDDDFSSALDQYLQEIGVVTGDNIFTTYVTTDNPTFNSVLASWVLGHWECLDKWYIESLGYTYGNSGYSDIATALTAYIKANQTDYWTLSDSTLAPSETYAVSLPSTLDVTGVTTLSGTYLNFYSWRPSSETAMTKTQQFYIGASKNTSSSFYPELQIGLNESTGYSKVFIGRTSSSGTSYLYIGTTTSSGGTGTHEIQIGGYKASGSSAAGGVASSSTQNLYIKCPTTFSSDVIFESSAAYSSSDKRLKQDIEGISASKKEALSNIEFKEYAFKSSPDKKHFGVIAQDLQEAGLTELLNEDSEGMLSVDYNSLFALKLAELDEAIKAVKKSKKILCRR